MGPPNQFEMPFSQDNFGGPYMIEDEQEITMGYNKRAALENDGYGDADYDNYRHDQE